MAKKVFIAVHGIGDQVRNATLQYVVERVTSHTNGGQPFPAAFGRLGHVIDGDPLYLRDRTQVRLPDGVDALGFAEVYWADIPRSAQSDYFLQESRSWALSLVSRLQAEQEIREREGAPAQHSIDYDRVAMVLSEMGQTIHVLDRLSGILRLLHVSDFKLDDLLDAFLGDVQFIAEFRAFRDAVLERFDQTLAGVAGQLDPEDEIHFVAHSEGTVVTFLGLLTLLAGEEPPAWLSQVRTLMTIGSPIDKHIVLWPELFDFERSAVERTTSPILWFNYYDRGDPVAYDLDSTRDWLAHEGSWAGAAFDFRAENDFGFLRYPFPGKAHLDYFQDDAVFGHYLSNAAGLPETDWQEPEVVEKPAPAPKTVPHYAWSSWIMPYLFAWLSITSGFVLLDWRIWLAHDEALGANFIWEVLAVSFLMAGCTVLARMPRLTTRVGYRVLGAVLFFVGVGLYLLCAHQGGHGLYLLYPRTLHFLGQLSDEGLEAALAAGANAKLTWETLPAFLLLPGVGLCVSLLVLFLTWRTAWLGRVGVKPLVALGAVVIVFLSLAAISSGPQRSEEWFWVVGAAVVFSYLWALGALLFDLTFVWHVYMRGTKGGSRGSAALTELQRDRRAAHAAGIDDQAKR